MGAGATRFPNAVELAGRSLARSARTAHDAPEDGADYEFADARNHLRISVMLRRDPETKTFFGSVRFAVCDEESFDDDVALLRDNALGLERWQDVISALSIGLNAECRRLVKALTGAK